MTKIRNSSRFALDFKFVLGNHLILLLQITKQRAASRAKTLKSRTKTIKKLIFSIEKANILIEKTNIFIKKANIFIEKLNIFIEKETKTIEIMTFSIEKSGKFRLSRPIVSRQQREFEAICRIFQYVR